MKTNLDCIPCFFKQALETARLSGADERTQWTVIEAVSHMIPELDPVWSPPEMARKIYHKIHEITGVDDPYRRLKAKSNRLALNLYPELVRRTRESADPLLTAVGLAIIGNIIDYGAKNELDVATELSRLLADEQRTIRNEDASLFQFDSFQSALNQAASILYLADNAGEIVFDRILIETIRKRFPKLQIRIAVKAKPAINDALMEDAVLCGLHETAEVISSGSDAPGTLLSSCEPSFLECFNSADMVISKGQGNFETLSGIERPVYFLLIAKCPVIARHIGCRTGDVILKRSAC